MIGPHNIAKVLGSRYDPGARYAMIETQASGRAGRTPARRQAMGRRRLHPLEGPGHWQVLGEFSDPEVQSARTFIIHKWIPKEPPDAAA